MADVVLTEDRVDAALKSLDAIAKSLARIAAALEGEPKKPIQRIAAAIEQMADKSKG